MLIPPKPIRSNRIRIADCVRVVCEHYAIDETVLRSRTQARHIVYPRQIAMWLARELTGASQPKIGIYFDRDHTTVIHAVRSVAIRRLSPVYAALCDLLRERVISDCQISGMTLTVYACQIGAVQDGVMY